MRRKPSFRRKSWEHCVIVRDNASRLRFLVLIAFLWLMAIASPVGSWAWAQDTDRGAAASSPGGAGTRLGGVDDDTTGAAASDQGGRTGEGGENFLMWMIRASG